MVLLRLLAFKPERAIFGTATVQQMVASRGHHRHGA
jgi:hypothetical protein